MIDKEKVRELWPVSRALSSFGIHVSDAGRMHCPICDPGRQHRKDAFSYGPDHWYCFRHGKGGDVFALVQHLAHTDFIGALNIMAGAQGNESAAKILVSTTATEMRGLGQLSWKKRMLRQADIQWSRLDCMITRKRDARLMKIDAQEESGDIDSIDAAMERSMAREQAEREWWMNDTSTQEICYWVKHGR